MEEYRINEPQKGVVGRISCKIQPQTHCNLQNKSVDKTGAQGLHMKQHYLHNGQQKIIKKL
jgi:hypothetical protein